MIDEDKAWDDYLDRAHDLYDFRNYDKSLQASVMRAGHKLSEKPFTKNDHFGRVLEIGAGTGEHLSFVRHQFDEYVLTDMSSRAVEVAKSKFEGKFDGRITFKTQEGGKLNYPDNSFVRMIACHVLEHILEPHLALKHWFRLIKNGGNLTILIPTDPGVAWRLSKCFGPRRKALALGVAYDYVQAREHVNSSINLVHILKHIFPDYKESWWPLHIASIDLNLFYVFHTTIRK